MTVEWEEKVSDHSYWNIIDSWQALYDYGIRTAVIRASSGATYKDPKFRPYRTDAKSVGILVLPYHVNNPWFSAEANIANFRAAIEGLALDGLPVLDNQLTGGMSDAVIRDRTRSSFNYLKTYYGGAINYTAKWWWNQHMGTNNPWVKEFPLWVANYWLSLTGNLWPSKDAYTTVIPTDYLGEKPFLWQFSDKGLLPLASRGNIDKNVAYPRFISSLFPGTPTLPSDNCEAFRIRVLGTMNIRKDPNIAAKVVGSASTGEEFVAEGVGGSEVWIKLGENKWIAFKRGAKVYCIKI